VTPLAPSRAPDAEQLLAAWDRAQLLDAALGAPPDLAAAEALQARVVAMRRARGERTLGYKIGFTNRSIWPLYGVHHPIWAPVYDTTVTWLEGTDGQVALNRFVQPRLEPEIVFGLRASPASADPRAVFDCIDWIAHGFEIVQSPFAGWKFDAAQAIAAQGLHGALLVGPRRPRSIVAGPQELAAGELVLSLDGREVARGSTEQVLGGPVQALGHLVSELLRRGETLAPDAIVTTGTITDAQPMRPGQQWRSILAGIELPGLCLRTA